MKAILFFSLSLAALSFVACKDRPERPGFTRTLIDRILPGSSNSDPGQIQPATSEGNEPSKPSEPMAGSPKKDSDQAKPPSDAASSSPAAPSIDRNSAVEVAKRFAPIIWLAPQEPYYPMDPEEFLRKAENDRSEEFFRSSRISYREGKQARIVVNISDDKTLVQYWIFYAKNGCQGVRLAIAVPSGINNPFLGKDIIKTEDKETAIEFCNLAIHEGDWENVTLRLNKDLSQIESAYLSAHGRGNWFPASALRMKGNRPLLYSAINSHALYPAEIDFAADATISKDQLAKVPSLQWFQVGDALRSSIGMQSDTSGGGGAVEFDTSRSLWMWSEAKNSDVGRFNGLWGKTVDGKTVLPPPKIANILTNTIFDKVSDLVFAKVSALEGKSNGNAPPSPWLRDDWKNFDCANCGGRTGLGRMALAGSSYGHAFDDYEKLKPRDRFKLKQIRLSGKSNITRLCAVVDAAGDNCHGGSWDGEQILKLDDDDYLQRLDVAFYESNGNRFVSAIKMTTKKGKVLQVGTWTSIAIEQSAPAGMQIVGFHGRADHDLRQLGIIVGSLP